METSTVIYGVVLLGLVGFLVGLVVYVKKQQGGPSSAVAREKPDRLKGKEEIVALPTEKLVDLETLHGDFLVTVSGDLVAMLEVNPVLMTSNSRPEALDGAFAGALETMPARTTLQFVQLPIPNQVDELTDRYARYGHYWRTEFIESQTDGTPQEEQQELQNRYYAANQIGATILQYGGQACYRASLIVLTAQGRAFGREISDKAVKEFSNLIQQVQGVFSNHGIQTDMLPPEISLHYLWYAYNADAGAQAVVDQAEERFATICMSGRTPPAELAALTATQLDMALSEPEKYVKRVIAPPLVEEGDAWVTFRQKSMLLYFITDYRLTLPRISRLLGPGGRYYNSLFVSYYLTMPSPDTIALQARKASTAKQAQQVIGQRLGTLPSYRQQEDVMAIEQARYGAETEKRLPRMLGLYIGVLVDSEKIYEEKADFEAVLQSAGLVFTPAKWTAMNIWRSMIPLGQRYHRFEDRNVFSENMASLNPVSSQTLFESEGDLLGFTAISSNHSMPVSVVRKRGSRIVPSDALVGAPGSGKSMTLKWWVTDWMVKRHRVMVIDPKLEFGPVVNTLGGSSVDAVGTTGFNLLRFDRFSVDPTSQLGNALTRMTFDDNLAAIEALYVAVKGGRASYISGQERNLLIRALQKAMRNKNMDPNDPTTWEPNGLFLRDVYQVLARELLHEAPDTINVMVNNLMQYGDPAGQYYKLYNTISDLDLSSDLVVITFGLSQFSADERVKSLAYHFALRIAAQHAIRNFIFSEEVTPTHIVIDEASQMLTSSALVSSVVRMLSLLPAYNISVHLAFQDMFALERADALGASEGSGSMNTLLGTIPAYWLFNQEPESAAKAVKILKLPAHEQGMIAGNLPGNCLVVFQTVGMRLPVSVKVPPTFLQLYKTDAEAMRRMLDAAIAR
ncbi:hypothetical protein KQH40_00965 [bacterium]|nr:hypothetical protein [bacterium]